jgi:heme O synthase-like polyprenyltransferase
MARVEQHKTSKRPSTSSNFSNSSSILSPELVLLLLLLELLSVLLTVLLTVRLPSLLLSTMVIIGMSVYSGFVKCNKIQPCYKK